MSSRGGSSSRGEVPASREKICLVLGGSFFPLHQGHINLLTAARDYLKTVPHKTVVQAILLPNHPAALRPKFPGLSAEEPDICAQEAAPFLQQHESWIRWDDRLLRAEKNTGMRATMEAMTQELAPTMRVVQVVGADSRVRSVLRDREPGSVLLVVDSRGVPPENADLLNSQQQQQQQKHSVCKIPPNEAMPPLSSTCLQFLNQERYPACCVPEFRLEWLTDTGLTLGAGRQGLVRLMRLGHEPVAVKLYKRSKNSKYDSFLIEEPLWKALDGRQVTPDLIAMGTVPDGRFSYIITAVGIPFDKLLPALHYTGTYKWEPKEERRFQPFFEEQVALYPLNKIPALYQPTRPTNNTERIRLAAKLIRGMILCQERLERCGIVHRDLKLSNFLYVPETEEVRVTDFGVALRLKDGAARTPCGSLRMCPAIAIDSFYYDYGCDEYLLANAVLEVINERSIYHECGDDVEAAILKRKGCVHPTWDEDFLTSGKPKVVAHMLVFCFSRWKPARSFGPYMTAGLLDGPVPDRFALWWSVATLHWRGGNSMSDLPHIGSAYATGERSWRLSTSSTKKKCVWNITAETVKLSVIPIVRYRN